MKWLEHNWADESNPIPEELHATIKRSLKGELSTMLFDYYPVLNIHETKPYPAQHCTDKVGNLIGVRGGSLFHFPDNEYASVFLLGVLEATKYPKYNGHNWFSAAKLTAEIIITTWNKHQDSKEVKKFLLDKLHETAKYEPICALSLWYEGRAKHICQLFKELATNEREDKNEEEKIAMAETLKNNFINDNMLI